MDIFTLQLQTIREMFNWRVSLDIFLIAMGLFFLYQTLRRLGTWKIVLGILIAGAVFIAARLLGLKGIEWIYSNLSSVVLIALIIIFQPELRKIFERAASFKWNEIGKKGTDLSFLLSNAIFALAQQKRGAILVFPGRESVRAWTSKGVSLDANPSFPLIMSLFDPHSPGHDGAMVIENGKISLFGVYLPISKTSKLPEEFGTRHHAAMGLSEVTDALVIVVSEERGSIAIFSKGAMQTVKDKNEVSSRIMSHWENTASYPLSKQKEKKRWVTVSEIAVCLILAFSFRSTAVITQSELRTMGFTVPIEYIATPTDVALVGEIPTEIKLHLAGSASDLDRIDPAKLRVKIDLSKAVPGKQTVIVTKDNIELPGRIRLLDVVPPSLELSLTKIEKKEAVVKLNWIGTLPEGLELESVEVNPQKMQVLSPANGRQKEIHLMTSPIYLPEIKENTRLFCKVTAPPGIQPAGGDQWPEVEVKIRVKHTTLSE